MTPRMWAVAELISRRSTAKAMSATLGVTEGTAKVLAYECRKILGLDNAGIVRLMKRRQLSVWLAKFGAQLSDEAERELRVLFDTPGSDRWLD